MKICSSHQDVQTPLISTMAFIGAEHWRPHCGKKEGLFGAGLNVEDTPELAKKLSFDTERSRLFLRANACLHAHMVKNNSGEFVKPFDLSNEEKAELELAINNQQAEFNEEERDDDLQEIGRVSQ
jgi:hypothetical protein